MDTSTVIIALFLGVIQIILIFAVLRTAENTKTLISILEKMSKDLSSITNQTSVKSTSTFKNEIKPKKTSNAIGRKECPNCNQFAFDTDKSRCLSCGYIAAATEENTESSIDLDGIAQTLRK